MSQVLPSSSAVLSKQPREVKMESIRLAFAEAFGLKEEKDGEPVIVKSATHTGQKQKKEAPRDESGRQLPKGFIGGEVDNFSHVLGIGNITASDGKRYFVNGQEVETRFTNRGFYALLPGQKVTFCPITTDRGPKALQVKIEGWTALQMEKQDDKRNYWLPNERGRVEVSLEGRTGLVKDGIEPALLSPGVGVAYFYTRGDVKGFEFALPTTKMVAAVGLDQEKGFVDPSKVPLGGFVIAACTSRSSSKKVRFVVRRFGARKSTIEVNGVNHPITTKVVIVEQRLSGEVFRDASTKQVEEYLKTIGPLPHYDAQFALGVKAAIELLR